MTAIEDDPLLLVGFQSGVRRVTLKVAVGDEIPQRHGSGQDVGAVYAEAETRAAVADALSKSSQLIRFELI